MTDLTTPRAVVDELEAAYAAASERLRLALHHYLKTGERPDPAERASGAFTYPELVVTYRPEGAVPRPSRAYALIRKAGVYSVTVTKPSLFRRYLIEQLNLLMSDFSVQVQVRASSREIPYPFVLDGAAGLDLQGAISADLARWFPTTQLAHIGDEVADGLWDEALEDSAPLALFDGPRADFSLARLKHYTGAPAEDCQAFILFTNYHRYVDEFVRWSLSELKKDGPYRRLSCAGGLVVDGDTIDAERTVAEADWRKYQMSGHYPCEHRRRPLERQDHHRPLGCAAPSSLADDRPLRRLAAQSDDRRLCTGARLSS